MHRTSRYRLMWMMVLFDLPVTEPRARRAATQFRVSLLKQGFEMAQFSVYVRFCGRQERYEAIEERVVCALPAEGKVHILRFTDRQYQQAVFFDARARLPSATKPDQLVLF